MGPFKGMHLSTDNLESLGRDLCRTVLVYTDLYIPPELQSLQLSLLSSQPSSPSKLHPASLDKKSFLEDKVVPHGHQSLLKSLLAEELKENKALINKGDGDSSSGSDSAPSEDNLDPVEMGKVVPVVDKKVKNQISKINKLKQQ